MIKDNLILDACKKKLKDFILSNEPIDTTRIVSAVLQDDFEESFNYVLEQPTVLECRIEKGIYYICMEYAGISPGS